MKTPAPTGGQVELKPCPFCGKPPLTKLLPSGRTQATCADCEVNWMSIEDWNTRATDSENAALREDVKKANLLVPDGYQVARDTLPERVALMVEGLNALATELARVREATRYVCDQLASVDCGAAPIEVLARRAAKAIAERDTLRATNAGLVEALGEDASGRPMSELLRVAADYMDTRGSGPVVDCLRDKAGQIDAALDAAKGGESK